MGVEYQHYIVPKDPHLELDSALVDRINEIMKQNGLWSEADQIFSVDDGGDVDRSGDKGTNGWRMCRAGNRGAHVAKAMGPSEYGVDDEDRYVKRVYIVFGNAYKMHALCENIYVNTGEAKMITVNTAVRPPIFSPIDEMSYDLPNLEESNIEYTNMNTNGLAWYRGWWKSAVIIDCGKDLPIWSNEMRMSNRHLIDSISNAIGEECGEIGHHY